MTLKYIYIVLILILTNVTLYSTTKEDSLITIREAKLLDNIRNNAIPKNAGDEINEIVKHYKFTDVNKGLAFIDTLLSKNIILTNDTLNMYIFSLLSGIYINLGQVELAARNLFRAYSVSSKYPNSLSNSWTLLEIGNLYYSVGKFEKSSEYYTNSLAHFKGYLLETDSKSENALLGVAVSLENLSLSLTDLNRFEDAIQKAKEAFTYRKKLNNSMFLQYSTMNIAKVLLSSKYIDSALVYFRKSLDYSNQEARYVDKSQQFSFKIQALNGLFRTFYKLKMVDSMNNYERKMQNLLLESGNLQHYVITNASNAYYFYENKDYIQSIKYGQTAINTAHKHKLDFLNNDIYNILYQSFDAMKNNDSAFKYLQLTHKLFDENKSKFVLQGIELSESNEKLERNLYEIEKLNNEKIKNEESLKDQRNLLIGSVVFILFLIAIVLSIISRVKYKNKMMQIVENKNKELYDAINQLHEYQKVLKDTNEELLRSNETKNTLFSIIAHDLKNSVGSVRNSIELLNSEYNSLEDDEIIEFLELSHKSSDNLYYLLENLLLWSSAQRNKINIHITEASIYFVAQQSISLYLQKAQSKNIQLINNLDKELILNFDPNLVDVVIRNLINNAVKFTNSGGEIIVSSEGDEKLTKIIIADNGVGMPKEKANNLFQFGNNTSTYGTSGEKGTGLGLLICKEFVELHKGKIWAESEEGIGTKVFFTLPR